MNRTRAALAALPLLALPLTACGGGGSSSAGASGPSSVPSSATKNSRYESLEDLRKAVEAGGIQCPDSIWKPNATASKDSYKADGWCGETVHLVIDADDTELGKASVLSDMAGQDLDKSLESPSSSSGDTRYLQGPNWTVRVSDKNSSTQLLSSMGGKDATPGG